ncbi:MAG: transketolase C-terminal domain-containing protein, partial [Myxococcota bacterium]
VIYDDNGISIDGSTDLAFGEDVEMRFRSQGWHCVRVDGHDADQIRSGIAAAQAETDRPSLVLARTRIGFGSPNREGTAKAHGEPLGDEEARLTKEKLGWTHPPFEVPDAAYAPFRARAGEGLEARETWSKQLESWLSKDPERATTWKRYFDGVPLDIDTLLEAMPSGRQATRGLSGKAINAIASQTPRLLGGSADLTGSNKSNIVDAEWVAPGAFGGRNIHFGVREHAMAAITNGVALYGTFVPYGATFLTFSDYMKNAVRLSALMRIRALQIYTHDSIGLGEDGPTHQPVEHLWSLRLIPGLSVWRPADGVETAMAWAYAVQEGADAPHALIFSRQACSVPERPSSFQPQDVWKGGYVVRSAATPQVVLVGTGTEVELAASAADALEASGVSTRVVSMPCVERFLEQDGSYQESVLPKEALLATVEAGSTLGWKALFTNRTLAFGVDRFGESAPAPEVYAHFGLTPESIAEAIRAAM